jgi:hypothetical protein
MKKLLIICLLFISYSSQAQPTDPSQIHPEEKMIMYNGHEVPGYTIEAPFSADKVEDAMRSRLKKMDVKVKESNDFWEAKNVVFPRIRKDAVDAYMKIERKSKKESDVSIVVLILTEPGVPPGSPESTIAAARGEKEAMDVIGAFGLLTKLNGFTDMNSAALDISLQEEKVKKSEKKNKDLIEDGEDLQKKLEKTQDDINDNKKAQEKQLSELNKQKEILMNLQAKRPASPAGVVN